MRTNSLKRKLAAGKRARGASDRSQTWRGEYRDGSTSCNLPVQDRLPWGQPSSTVWTDSPELTDSLTIGSSRPNPYRSR